MSLYEDKLAGYRFKGGTAPTSEQTWVWDNTNKYFKPGTPLNLGVTYATAYGVTADGTTDDTAALQAAIDAAPTNGTVVLPRGTILYTTIAINKGLTLRGQGYPSTFLKQTANGDGVTVNVGGGAQISNVLIEDILLGASADRTSGAALRLGYVGFCHVNNVRITNALGGKPFEGLRIDRASDCHFSKLIVQGCASNGAVIQPGSSTSVIVEIYFDSECMFRSCEANGMYVLMDQVYSNGVCSVEGGHVAATFYNNTLAGVRMHATIAGAEIVNWHFNGATFDSNQGTSNTAGSADGGLVADASFNSTAFIRRLHICLAGAWSSNNGNAGLYLSKVRDFTICCGSVHINDKIGIDLQTCVFGTVTTHINDNSNAADNTSYGLQIGGSSADIAVASDFDNTDSSANDQRGVNIGSSATDLDFSLSTFRNQDVATVPKINGGNGASNVRLVMPPGVITAVQTANYQCDAGLTSPDAVIRMDTTAAGLTATLPRAANYPSRRITVKRSAGANTVTIAATAGTVETTSCTTTPVTHQSDGTNWIDVS